MLCAYWNADHQQTCHSTRLHSQAVSGKVSESLTLFKQAVAISPTNVTYRKQASLQQSISYSLNTVQNIAMLQVARSLYLLGQYAAADHIYNETAQIAPCDWEVWHNRGLCSIAAKDYDRSMPCRAATHSLKLGRVHSTNRIDILQGDTEFAAGQSY